MPIRLEPLTAEHLPDLEALVADEDVLRFTRIPVPPPAGFARSWFARYERGRAEGTNEAFAIVDGEDGAFLGLALAPRIEEETRTVELGYIVAPPARGRGVASGALRLLTEWAFAELGAERLELLIAAENDASKKVAERCGYTREGLLRSLHFKQGRRDDCEIWSRLPADAARALEPAAVVTALWEAFEARDWDAARALLHPELEVEWPPTGERFDRDGFMRVNETYPESWSIDLRRVTSAGGVVFAEAWVDHTDPSRAAWAIGRYEVAGGLIRRATEYWAPPGDPAPERAAPR